jgi:hypothetical protein
VKSRAEFALGPPVPKAGAFARAVSRLSHFRILLSRVPPSSAVSSASGVSRPATSATIKAAAWLTDGPERRSLPEKQQSTRRIRVNETVSHCSARGVIRSLRR